MVDRSGKGYSDEQLEIDYPEFLRPCQYCRKKFATRFDARYCSDKCFHAMVREQRKKLGTYVKSKDREYTKSTHRPDKNWKNPQEIDIP